MGAQLRNTQVGGSTSRKPLDGVQEIVRMLVSRLPGAGDPNKPGVSGPDSDGVILDIEVEGVRCLLIRAKDSSTVTHTWLSPRELEIARMVSKGHPNKLIAAMLDISSWTVSTYLRRIFAKFAVTSRAAMVAKLHEQGLLGELHANPKGTLPAMTAVAEMGSGVVPASSASLR